MDIPEEAFSEMVEEMECFDKDAILEYCRRGNVVEGHRVIEEVEESE